jgi:hypothetical protein
MAARKPKEDERLYDIHLEKVIELLEQEKPITKKEACSILNITYNTTRLGTLIEKYKEKKAKEAARRAELRGRPPTQDEIVYFISEYINGATIDSISRSSYRSPQLVKKVLEEHAVPIRASSHDYFRPELIPLPACRDRFAVGEVVYSARYDSTAVVDKELNQNGDWIYRIWLLAEKWKQYAYQEVHELASLEHLRKLGVRV